MSSAASSRVWRSRGASGSRPSSCTRVVSSPRLLQPQTAPAKCGDGIGGKPHGLADLAQRRAAAIADHRGGEAGALAAVFPVDILDHLLAPLMLEIHVDIRRLLARGADEALEQEIHVGGIDGGDAEAIADGGIGGRAAALAEDVLRAGVAHQIMDGEEIRRVVELVDEGELMLELGAHLLRHAVGIAGRRAQPGEMDELLLGLAPRLRQLIGIFVAQLVEGEAAALGDLHRPGQRLGMIGEEQGHLRRGFHMPLGIGEEAIARLLDGAMLADAGQHILQRPARGNMGMDIVDGDQRRGGARGQGRQPSQAPPIVAAIEMLAGQIDMAGEAGGEILQQAPPATPPPPRASAIMINPAPRESRSARSRWHSPLGARRRPKVMSRASRP